MLQGSGVRGQQSGASGQGLFKRIQAKLKIGKPNDKYEKEADRVADRVMRMEEGSVQSTVGREQESGNGNGKAVQTKPLSSQITPIIQRQVEPDEEKEEEQTEEEPIRVSDCRECEEADKAIMFKLNPNTLQRSPQSALSDEGSMRKRIVEVAHAELGKVEAKKTDGTGRRIGYQRLLEYFHLAAPGVWPDSVIEFKREGFPSWCGIFSVYAIKTAGIDVGNWQMGRGVSAFNSLEVTSHPEPGDIGYIDKPYQHHCIVTEVNGDTVKSIDGNSGWYSEVIEKTRPISTFSGFFTPFTGREKYIQKKENELEQIQTKLKMGRPNDLYEQEADKVANQVMRMDESKEQSAKSREQSALRLSPCAAVQTKPLIQRRVEEEEEEVVQPKLQTSFVQRQVEEEEEEEEEPVQTKPLTSDITPLIQRKAVEQGVQEMPEQEGEVNKEELIQPKLRTNSDHLIQRQSEAGATTHTQTPTSEEAAAPELIVEDSVENLQSGQMKRSEFLAVVREEVCKTVEPIIASTGRTADNCPYLVLLFRFIAGRNTRYINRTIRKFAPAASNLTNARGYIPIIKERVRQSAEVWVRTGEITGLPSGVPTDLLKTGLMGTTGGSGLLGGVGRILSGIAGIFFKKRNGASNEIGNPQEIQRQLSSGHSLEGSTKSRMESAFGQDFSQVRVHTDSDASKLSGNLNARAFTVGKDIAFGSGEYQPGTPVGDAIIAHELAHTVQQGGGNNSGTQMKKEETSYNALEEDADISAVGAVVSKWSGVKEGFGDISKNALPRLKSSLRLQRCSDDQAAPPINYVRYNQIAYELKMLINKKKKLVESDGSSSMSEIDSSIELLIKELREDFGVLSTKGHILEAAVAGKNMLQFGGRIVQSPEGEPFMGQRRKFHAELDYVPPGESVKYGWRWKTNGRENRFFVSSSAMAARTKLPVLELDDAFWGMFGVLPPIQKAGGMEVLCHVYVGGSKTPSYTLTTGFRKYSMQIPSNLKIIGSPRRTVKGASVQFRVGPWVPPANKYSIDWYIDGKKVATNFHVMKHTFDRTGTFKVDAKVSKVRKSFWTRDKKHFRNAETTTIEVLGVDAFGEKFMEELDKSPLRPKTPKLKELVGSIRETIKELEKKVAKGGDQKEYWEDRLEAQKKRLRKIVEHAPDINTAKELPGDPTKFMSGQSYNGPVNAVLVMPEGGGAQPLSLYLTVKKEGAAYKAQLIDVTSSKVLKFDGTGTIPLDAYEAVFADWEGDNEYPTGGRIVHRFKPSGWKKGKSFATTTTWKKSKEWVDGIITVGGVIVGALLLAAPDATITKVLGYTLLAAVVARSSVAIYERIDKGGDTLSTENILDGVAIVTAFTGITGSVLRTHGINTVRPMMYRVGNWTIMSTLAADVGTFVYASAEAIATIKAIQANPQLDESQKLVAILRIMSGLFLNGALLIVTNRDLVKSGLKPTDFIKRELPKGASPDLDIGTRLDVEYELKKAGKWTKETSKLSDEAVLDKLFKVRARKEAKAKISEIEAKLSPDAKAELHEFSKGKDPEEVWGFLERQKDPVKALEGRARSKREAARKVAESNARFNTVHDQLSKSGFLNRPLVSADIAAKDKNALRSKIAEHLAELQAKKDFDTKEGYRVLDDIDVSEQFGTYRTLAEAMADVPKGKIYPLYELGGKVWRRLTNIDVLVVRDIKGKSKSEVTQFKEVKSGKHDSPAKAKKQQQTTIDALAEVAAGNDKIRLHQHRHNDITDKIDARTATADKAKTAGPDDKAFETKLGVTQGELKKLATRIIEEAHK